MLIAYGGGEGKIQGQKGARSSEKGGKGDGNGSAPELKATTQPYPARWKCTVWKVEGEEEEEVEECHTGRETRYLSGSTEKVQEEELKQQHNGNRNSEEGLQSGGEGKQRGLGMAPDQLATDTHA